MTDNSERSQIPPTSNVEVALTDLERYCSGSASALHSIAVVDAEIERLELRCAALLEAECDKCPAVTERDRLRRVLEEVRRCLPGTLDRVPELRDLIERALSGEPGSAVETSESRPIDCKHERAKVQCPDCGIDFLGGIRTAPRDVPIWICSVCGGWNHLQDKFCTHTHAVQSAEKAEAGPTREDFLGGTAVYCPRCKGYHYIGQQCPPSQNG